MVAARTLTFAIVYFAAVFGAGFVFGVIRTLLLAPAVGESTAGLIEAPFMLAVIFERDVLAGSVYYALIVAFAVMPYALGRPSAA